MPRTKPEAKAFRLFLNPAATRFLRWWKSIAPIDSNGARVAHFTTSRPNLAVRSRSLIVLTGLKNRLIHIHLLSTIFTSISEQLFSFYLLGVL